MFTQDENGKVKPGLKCPECGFHIEFSIQDLLTRDDFNCAGCGQVFSLDRTSSRESMEALSQLKVAIDNLEYTKNKFS